MTQPARRGRDSALPRDLGCFGGGAHSADEEQPIEVSEEEQIDNSEPSPSTDAD